MPGILLRIPYIQNKVSEVATTQLSGHLGVPVKIGNVDIEWFNRLVLEGLYLEDQDGKVMFEANHVAAGFEIMPLLEGKFVFTTVRLFGFSFNLRKHTPESPLEPAIRHRRFRQQGFDKEREEYRSPFQLHHDPKR